MTYSTTIQTLLSDTNTLYGWMGRFWQNVYTEPDFIKRCLDAKGMTTAQLGLNADEARTLVDRRNISVLHRERWFPIVIRYSQRGTGGAAALRLGAQPTPVLGPQNPTVFQTGRVFQLGGYVAFRDLTSYPIDANVTSVTSLLVDSFDNPQLSLSPSDFAIERGTLVIRRAVDPFDNPNLTPDIEYNTDGTVKDKLLTLWGMDTLMDWHYIARYLGYIVGFNDIPSTAYHKRLVNAMWDTLTGSSTELNTLSLAAAVYDIPQAEEAETVTALTTDTDSTPLIVTATRIYRVAYPSSSIVVGTQLYKGQLLSDSVKMYSNLFEPRQFGDILRTDVPAVTFPRTFFAADMQHGLTAQWERTPVWVDGFDANGNPRMRFSFGGDADDEQSFWEYFWAQCEMQGISSRTCFSDLNDDIVIPTDGMTLGYVEPLDYMLRNLVGANCSFLVVDNTQLTTAGKQASVQGLIGLLHDTLPRYTRMFIIEHKSVPPEEYDLTTSQDSTATAVGMKRTDTMRVGRNYRDTGVRMKWVAICK